METTNCSIDCIIAICPALSFLQKHESFVLSIVGFIGAGVGMILNYFIRSRCTKIRIGCISCNRNPIDLSSDNIQIKNEV
tara:strand:- start:1457 stop:1696 length:240 start_codon:yes stop_codon:yes gene_type:complete